MGDAGASGCLASPQVVADSAGTFAGAWNTTDGVTAITGPPGGGFGGAATFPGGTLSASGLNIAPGHAGAGAQRHRRVHRAGDLTGRSGAGQAAT
jgi:hypothetical protein